MYNDLNEQQQFAVKELVQSILKDVVYLVYTKVDGTTRGGNATLNTDVIVEAIGKPQEGKPDAKPRKENPHVIRYFDVDKGEFRTFKLENLVTIGEFGMIHIVQQVKETVV